MFIDENKSFVLVRLIAYAIVIGGPIGHIYFSQHLIKYCLSWIVWRLLSWVKV